MKPITLTTLKRKLSFWKKRLGLEEWDISIALCSRHMVGCTYVAVVDNVDCDNMSANIKVNKEYHEIATEEDTVDITIVHELVHIIFHESREALPYFVKRRKDMKDLEERICDYFAEVFVSNLQRTKRKK